MAHDPEELRHHDADHLPARRHNDTRQFFDRSQIREIVHHAAEIINAVGVRNVGVPRLALPHLFRAAMMKANLRYGIYNLFAIQLERYTQNAMRPRVLWTYIQKKKVG